MQLPAAATCQNQCRSTARLKRRWGCGAVAVLHTNQGQKGGPGGGPPPPPPGFLTVALNLLHHVQALNHAAKHNVLAVPAPAPQPHTHDK
jgi:hypothetical protein